MAHASKAIGEWAARDFGKAASARPTRRPRLSSSRAPLCAIAVGSRGMVNVRAMCISDRRAIEGGACDDRSGAAEGLLTWHAGPVALPEPRRRPRTLLLALLAGLSCALVSCFAYSESAYQRYVRHYSRASP